MGKCINHPDRETNFMCMKHNIYMCEECMVCRDPEIHCKFRSSCPIWFMEKRGGKGIDDIPEQGKPAQHRVVFMPANKEVLDQFMDEFTSALFLPHTNIEDFPSVKGTF
ncbi:MAG: hypothetical protein J7K96_02670 [Desulfobacteraceae bacterium]|nr:hypothetical protein [Desulfobacteraceae bacterium]